MNDGKMPENVLRRAVLGRIKEINKDVITGAAFGEDCAILNCNKNATAVGMAIGVDDSINALYRAANNLAAGGYRVISFSLAITIPIDMEEPSLKSMMERLVNEASLMGAQISGGHTEASKAVNDIVVSATAFGTLMGDNPAIKKSIKAGDKIIATKWVGLEGISIIYNKRRDELVSRFGKDFLNVVDRYKEWLSVIEESEIATSLGAIAMKDVSERGIFQALWEMGCAANRGLKVDLKSIPVRQETVEICNYYNINPYALKSQGMLLIVARDTEGILNKLTEREIPCRIIGEFTDNNDRIVINEDEIRHLDKIKQDEIYKLI